MVSNLNEKTGKMATANKETEMNSSPIMPPSSLVLPDKDAGIIRKTKKRKIDQKAGSEFLDFSFDKAISIIRKNMIKVENENHKKVKSEYQDNEAFTKLRIKTLEELKSDSEDENEEEGNISTPATSPVTNSSAIPFNFGPGVYVPENKPKPKISLINVSNIQQLCFHCKRFGHSRMDCVNQWYHWWPKQYLDLNPWLRQKIFENRKKNGFVKQPYLNFQQFHLELQKEAEDREWEELQARRKHSNRYFNTTNTQNSINRFENSFPKAIRRLTPISKSNPVTKCKTGAESEETTKTIGDFGNALDIFERLQSQIEDLKTSLNQLKMHQDPKILKK